MSVHIEDTSRIDAVLIDGNWLGVDPGSLARHIPANRSSVSTAVVYHWTFATHEFMASAADVKAFRLLPAK